MRFEAGDLVRVRTGSPSHHHRTPLYVKGKTGRVAAPCGVFHNPESRAYGGSGLPKQPLYRVEFDQAYVWGSAYTGPPRDTVYVDIYEHWLEPAQVKGAKTKGEEDV